MSIPSAEYRQRRERFMAYLGKGLAVIRSAPIAVMHNDVDYPYRQDSDFFYLSGFDEPDAALILAPHCEQQFVMFVQPRDPHKEAWTGYLTGVEGAKERFGADEAFPLASWTSSCRSTWRAPIASTTTWAAIAPSTTRSWATGSG